MITIFYFLFISSYFKGWRAQCVLYALHFTKIKICNKETKLWKQLVKLQMRVGTVTACVCVIVTYSSNKCNFYVFPDWVYNSRPNHHLWSYRQSSSFLLTSRLVQFLWPSTTNFYFLLYPCFITLWHGQCAQVCNYASL